MVVISGARALRHPLPNGRRAPCRRPKPSEHAHCPQQRETLPVICVKSLATRNSLDYVPGPCYPTIQ